MDADTIADVQETLEESGIPFRSGLLSQGRPVMQFWVEADRLSDGRELLSRQFGARLGPGFRRATPAFPKAAMTLVGAAIAIHFLIVIVMGRAADSGRSTIVAGSLLKGRTLEEPWRLLSSMFLHSGPRHVFWNGASMMVFGVPLIGRLYALRTAMIYFASGIGGGLMALYFADEGKMVIGSSGGVAGLFGAWVVLTLKRAKLMPRTSRHTVRTLGIALLVLPSLLTPISASGNPVSISAHMGGLATGMAIGAMLSSGLLARRAIRRA